MERQDHTTLHGFGPGTLIDTTSGAVPIEWLSSTDALVTRRGAMSGQHEVCRVEATMPLVAIDPGAFGAPNDQHPLLTTHKQALLVEDHNVAFHFGFDRALVRFEDMLDHPGVSVPTAASEHLFVLVTQRPTVIRANGLWVESTPAEAGATHTYPRLRDWECAMLMKLRGQWEQERYSSVA